jgi:hypothetical protein
VPQRIRRPLVAGRVFGRVERVGDLFAPVLTQRQTLP